MHGLIVHQLVHQVLERPIRIHQLRSRTNKVIRNMFHTTEKAIFKNIIRIVHPVGDFDRESHNRSQVSCRRCNFRNDNMVLGIQAVHFLNLLNGGVSVGPVVVHSEVVRRVVGDFLHEVRDPSVPGGIACAGRADELIAFISER